jgi:hypothetical protein
MLVSVRLEIVLFLMQDMCTVCAKRTTGSKLPWTHPTEQLGDLRHVECHFNPFGESLTIGAR